MADYIRLEAAICTADYAADEHPYSKEPDKLETYSNYNRGWNDACDYIRDRLEALSAEVRHGEWVKMYNNPNDGNYYCSECHNGIDVATGKVTPIDRGLLYCPNCDTKMDGDSGG